LTIEELKNKKVGFVSLGCDKNRVDLERIIFNISNFGFSIVNNTDEANIIIVNTCSFLESARLESIENIVEMANLKNTNSLEKLIVTGCLNELNYHDLNESLPEVDAFVNVKDNDQIVKIIANLYDIDTKYSYLDDRVLTTPSHYAYLKISEGCNNFCTYCLIPYIRGRYKSVPIEQLIIEAKNLADKGVKELILVAQDVTKYGVDLYNEKKLVELIRQLSNIGGIQWIRLLYCYPEEIDDALISEIKVNPKVLKYLDIPLQHVSTSILKAMNRRSNFESICELFDKLKSEIPNIAIRTTFILGFPGETDENVKLIENFLIKYKLQNVGFFTYSREEGTNAFKLPNQINETIKLERLNYLSQIQYDIVQENNQSIIGKELIAIVDEVYDDYSVCRYYGQCPQIDTVIYVNEKLVVGDFIKVRIEKILEYDLEGVRL